MKRTVFYVGFLHFDSALVSLRHPNGGFEMRSNNTGIIELNSDGTGRALSGPSATIVISSTDNDPKRSMTFAAATSRVKIAP